MVVYIIGISKLPKKTLNYKPVKLLLDQFLLILP